MSSIHKETITCPHCSNEGEIDIWNSINVDLNPELKPQIFNEKIWAWICPSCGETIYVPWGTLYHDMSNKFMLFFSFCSDDVECKYVPFELPDDIASSQKDYIIRSVYGVMNLKEKIVILENNLNDVAIERMKYMISHIVHPEIAAQGYSLYFAKIDPTETEISEHGTIYFFYDDTEKKEVFTIRYALDNYFEHCLAVKVDPRMELKGNKCIDEGWIAQQLKLAKL